MKKQFTKDDLKVGMVVEFRNGYFVMFMTSKSHGFIFVSHDHFVTLNEYDDLLLYKGIYILHDIVKVYSLSHNNMLSLEISTIERDLLWERKEETKEKTKEMTLSEISEALGYDVKIVKEEN